MPPSVNTMARASQVHAIEPPSGSQIESANAFNIREFVVDEDAAQFNSALWKTIDQSAFVMAQREALEAFNVAKALRMSEVTAAEESKRRIAVGTVSTSSSSANANTSVVTQGSSSSAGPSSSATNSQPIPIRKDPPRSSTSDEAAAVSLASSWQVDAVQTALLENKASSSSSANAKPSSSPPSSYPDKEASASIAKQRSQHLSLSTSSSSFSVPQVQVVDSQIASESLHSHSHSRASSQSNAIPSSSSQSQSHLHSHPHRIEQRSLSKREPETSSSAMSHSISSRSQISDVTNTKRRRTERQPSISSASPNTLVAPPISESKKSTASARDVRLGQIMNPAKENSTQQTPTEQTRSRRRSAHQTSEGRDLFTATRNCAKCGNLVVSPRSQPSFMHDPFSLPFSELLHVTCSACGTNHCRGCFSVVRCPRQCTGGSSCTVRNCCPDIRAIAIFEALSSFDHIYASEAGFTGKGGKQQRQAYLKLLISKADKSMRRFEDAFVRTLRILCSWLQPSSGSDDVEDERGLHPSIALLFANSYLPEVMHGFLSNNNVRDWVAHSETYTAVLETLRRMFDCGLSGVLMEPLRHIEQSCGLQQLVWDGGAISWEVDKSNVPLRSVPLSELVKQLEAHRRPLMALATKVNFSATVEKVNNLCDGISYLLLQQVVGGL